MHSSCESNKGCGKALAFNFPDVVNPVDVFLVCAVSNALELNISLFKSICKPNTPNVSKSHLKWMLPLAVSIQALILSESRSLYDGYFYRRMPSK